MKVFVTIMYTLNVHVWFQISLTFDDVVMRFSIVFNHVCKFVVVVVVVIQQSEAKH